MRENTKKTVLKMQSGVNVNESLLRHLSNKISSIEFLNVALANYDSHTQDIFFEKNLLALKWGISCTPKI